MITGDNGTQLTMPVMPAGMGGYGGGFGADGGWWGILFIIALLCGGWGGLGGFGGMGGLMGMWPFMFGGFGGWGNGGGSASAQGALTREQACIDQNFNNLARTTEGIARDLTALNSTICHQEYETAQLINGVGNTVQQGFMQAELSRCNQQATLMAQLNAMNITAMQNANAAQAQLADCCCKEQIGQMQLGNQIERGFCQTNFNDQANTTAIIQNAHNDTDRILARLDSMESARKDEIIAAQNQRIFFSELAASQAQQTAQIQASADARLNQVMSIVNPRPVPAYPAASPCGLGNWSPSVLANGYGFGNGCCNQGC